MRALVTNDDGIDSFGLRVLATAAIESGYEVVVAAPIRESSGTSAGLTASGDDGGVLVERRALPGLSGTTAHAVAAHPAFIVLAAMQGAFGTPPDLVLSGVNHGANVGRAILHSGTVGAALTATIHGARAAAVSLATGLDPGELTGWDSVRLILRDVLPMVADLDEGCAFNINIPNLMPDRLGSLAECPLARVGTVQTRIEQVGTDQLRKVPAPLPDDPEPGTDAALLGAGHPTLTRIRPIESVEQPTPHVEVARS